jgi:GTP-binding protein HflX
VVDAANPNFPEQMAEVSLVLREIGADDVPQLLVFNKLDALDKSRWPLQMQDEFEVDGQQIPRIFLSAHTGEGMPALRQKLAELALAKMSRTDAPTQSPEWHGDGVSIGTIQE